MSPERSAQPERFGPQLGNIEAILRTKGEMTVRFAPRSASVFSVASQVSRNLYQYFGASCNIAKYSKAIQGSGNVITILQGSPGITNLGQRWTLDVFPVAVTSSGVEIKYERPSATFPKLYANEPGLGAIFITPRSTDVLELCIWGFDAEGLRQASRLAPTLTGIGQPDFVVFGKQSAWKGASGVLAMGFLDSQWRVSRGSFLG